MPERLPSPYVSGHRSHSRAYQKLGRKTEAAKVFSERTVMDAASNALASIDNSHGSGRLRETWARIGMGEQTCESEARGGTAGRARETGARIQTVARTGKVMRDSCSA